MSDWADQPKPVKPDDVLGLGRQFMRHWSVRRLARVGLHQHVREILYELLDNGEFILPKPDELHDLTEFLTNTGATDRAYDGGISMTDELQSVIKKIHFAHGRHYGLTNYDMGIEEDA
jgi:hypothetical protein